MSALDVGGEGPQIDFQEVALPDLPDEELDTATNRQAWLVKLPNFLADRWESLSAENREVGRLRIYNTGPDGKNHITVILPNDVATPASSAASEHIPSEYDLHINNTESKNLFVFAERKPSDIQAESREMSPIEGPARKRRRMREPAMVGTVVHECNLTPDVEAPAYRNIMRQRQKKAEQPHRQTQMLSGSRASQNMLMSGSSSMYTNAKLSSFVKTKSKEKGTKLVKLPANEVRDLIFGAFEEYDYWSIKSLKEKVKQPETYIRDLLQEIAAKVERGPYTGLFALLPAFKKANASKEGAADREDDTAEGQGGDDDDAEMEAVS